MGKAEYFNIDRYFNSLFNMYKSIKNAEKDLHFRRTAADI